VPITGYWLLNLRVSVYEFAVKLLEYRDGFEVSKVLRYQNLNALQTLQIL